MPSPLYYQNNHINNFAIKNPISPHPGNVSTHVIPISLTMPQLTLDNLRAAPTPMIAVVLV